MWAFPKLPETALTECAKVEHHDPATAAQSDSRLVSRRYRLLYWSMQADQPNLAAIVDNLAGDMPDAALLEDLADDQLAAVGRIALQHHRNVESIVGPVAAALYKRHDETTWRDVGDILNLNHMTAYRWAKPFLGGSA
jgi:hypothetical protein